MADDTTDDTPFWKRKTLEEMTAREWESLCDGCARCCMVKIPKARGEGVVATSAACALLDGETARCTHYATRTRRVPDCQKLTPALARSTPWLPATCAYRRLAEGKSLPAWHPLRTGDPESVHTAGISMRGRSVSEEFIHPSELTRLRVRW